MSCAATCRSPVSSPLTFSSSYAEVGINLTIDVEESGTFLDNASAGKLPLFMLGWGADYPDATNFLDYHFGSGANDSFGNKFAEITAAASAGCARCCPGRPLSVLRDGNTAIRDLSADGADCSWWFGRRLPRRNYGRTRPARWATKTSVS